ncbi:Casein kinase I-like protein 1 [Anopheles sinensis]|uniref:Casein kinase I-like protein 1 n=1 Tax=Anopheles sinensis TaxID=74873 RepID=A0A084WC18_ANOSI|nr:Casein kinase I-like protein 1 [Anopheles sinensis]
MKTKKKDGLLIRNEYFQYSLIANQLEGFAKVHAFGENEIHNFIVMDFLEPSLELLFKTRLQPFNVYTVLLLADQMVKRLKNLHMSNIIHRNIRPEHFGESVKQQGVSGRLREGRVRRIFTLLVER